MRLIWLISMTSLGSSLFGQEQTVERVVSMGDSTVIIRQYKSTVHRNILFLNVHEDEQTSIEAVRAFAGDSSLNFFYLEHQGTRRIEFSHRKKFFSIDPNRIYTSKGRKNTLKDGGKYSWRAGRTTKRLAQEILDLIKPNTIVVAMHNNTDVNYSIKSYLPGGDEAANTKDVFVTDSWDPDDFVYTTVPEYFEALKANDVNVILQDNSSCVDDGSLSVYCGKNKIPYLNIEAQKGHLEEQIQLISEVMRILVP